MAHLRINHVTSYKELDEWMNGRETKQVGYHTVARRGLDNLIIIRQWDTDIYTLTPDDIATLRVDGWYTVTTKQRLNDLLPLDFKIFSEKGRWWIYRDGVSINEPFADGVQINVEMAQVVANPNCPDFVKQDAENNRIKKQIAAYVKGLTDEKVKQLYDDAVANGTGGDCWFCLMFDNAAEGTNLATSIDHLLSHLDEKYHMISLNLNALKESHYAYPEAVIGTGDIVRRAVSKYLRKRLLRGVAVA